MTQYNDQEKILEIIGFINKSIYPQSFIFGGTKGIGKATAAKDLVKRLLPGHNDILHHSLWLASDGIVVTIDQVRQIRDFFSHTLNNHFPRIVVIDSADELNINSSNALLKILEEPPKQSLLILISHQPHNLIDTIKSRCAFIKFKVPSNTLQIVQKDHNFDTKNIDTLLKLSHNVPGVAILLGKNQGLELYNSIISALSNYETSYTKTYSWIESTFPDNNPEKWWLFGYLIKYLLEKIIKISHIEHQDNNLFEQEALLIKKLSNLKSTEAWLLTYDESCQLLESAKKLYLDYKNIVVVIMMLISEGRKGRMK